MQARSAFEADAVDYSASVVLVVVDDVGCDVVISSSPPVAAQYATQMMVTTTKTLSTVFVEFADCPWYVIDPRIVEVSAE